jgi:DMSO/TMAO reductase YedYZ molybdopterin-dependent catalytic subunit
MRLGRRQTNLALLGALVLAFATGAGAVATGSAHGRWAVVGHGVAGVLVVLLVPWKTRVIRSGIRRARSSRWLSYALAAFAVLALLGGLGAATGLVRSIDGTETMWYHVAAALCVVPLVVWHIVTRPTRPRRTDLDRRLVLRSGVLLGAAAAAYTVTDVAVRLVRLPGAARRFTGSYETGSFQPAAMPNTSWLDDPVPAVDPDTWTLTVVDAHGERAWTLDDLARFDTTGRAVLDCTSGWYAVQDWTGAPLSALVQLPEGTRSILVRSVTGYWLRLPADDLDHLLVATRVGGQPLSPGHGYPARLVVPGRRGFWWVKWVDRVEAQTTPWWWQPPFPLT